MKISRLTFEGSVEEFRAVASDLFQDEQTMVIDQTSEQEATAEIEAMRQMLRRAIVPAGQRELYQALYRVGPDGLAADDLADGMGRTRDERNGVLGALGRRINGTELVNAHSANRKPGLSLVLEMRNDGEWWYALKPDFRRVLEEEGLVSA